MIIGAYFLNVLLGSICAAIFCFMASRENFNSVDSLLPIIPTTIICLLTSWPALIVNYQMKRAVLKKSSSKEEKFRMFTLRRFVFEFCYLFVFAIIIYSINLDDELVPILFAGIFSYLIPMILMHFVLLRPHHFDSIATEEKNSLDILDTRLE